MSATLQDSTPVREILKPTGFSIPSDMANKTWGQATLGGSDTVEANKEATIDAMTYTQAVEITPTSGKTSMAKTTVTVTGIIKKLFAYGSAEGVVYLTAIPSADSASVAVYTPSAAAIAKGTGAYTKEADKVTVSDVDYARYADGDITF